MDIECIVCRDSNGEVVFKEFDIDILRCQNCGHVFSCYRADQYHDGYFGEQVESEEQFWWNEAHQRMYDDFCRRFIVGKGGRLLDVGCGLGYFVRRISSFPNWQAFGYEISQAAVEFAQSRLGLDNIFCGKVEESGLRKSYFDIITLWDVIEHIPDPDPLLSYLWTILKDDGILFVHTPNVQIQLPKARITKFFKGMNPRLHYLEAKDHVNIYSMSTLRTVLCRNGFNRVEFIHLHPIQSLAGSRNALLTCGKNTIFHFSRVLFTMSFRTINLDNLFAIAKK